MDKYLHDLGEALLAILLSFLPSALGATVSMMVDDGITWAKMFARLWVGIVVSYFVKGALVAILSLHPFVVDAVSFLTGMVAYKSAPGFIAGCAAVLGEAPGQLRDKLIALLPSKEKK